MMSSCRLPWILLLVLVMAASCRKEEYEATPLDFEIPYGFPTMLNIPADNPMTVEGVALGRMLFEDGHLCGYSGADPDSLMSCATCHVRANNYDVGMDNPRFPEGAAAGRSGIPTHHSVMPLCNVVFNRNGYFWNGFISNENPRSDRRNIEDIVVMTIEAPDEMNSTAERAVAAVRADSRYPEMFRRAFGTEDITIDRISKAIAQYVRSLVSANSKFDRYLQGREQLTPQELQGYILFTTEEGADCFHCHGSDGSPLFTTNLFYNNGLDAVCPDPQDRSSVTGLAQDRGRFRAPSLRNVAVSAPYMHDGRYKTLDEVIEFYNTGLNYSPCIDPLMHKIGQGGAQLTPPQTEALKAFLLTLTDDAFLGNQPAR